MAKINITIPEPSEVYDKDTQRQIIQAIDTAKTQLNTSYQEDLRQEVERFTWFNG